MSNDQMYEPNQFPHPNPDMTMCWLCGADRTKCMVDEEPDACLGRLDGVRNATCGHGQQWPYVQFDDMTLIEGREAMLWFEEHGVGPRFKLGSAE